MTEKTEPASQLPLVAIDDIHQAARRIADHVVFTPMVPCESLSRQLGCNLHFKAENLQHVGAFKARGAVNAVFSLSQEHADRGVVTHSSGNHAAALARAAMLRGIRAHVVMPANSLPGKIAAVKSYGVTPVLCEPSTEAREAAAEQLRRETGATLVRPFDDLDVIAGQGTVGLEMLQQLENLDAIIAPVGGGGLLAGILTAVKAVRPQVKVYAAEPALADDTARSLAAGSPQMPTRYDTIADGLRTQVGNLTFPIIQRLLDDLVLVSEATIESATRAIAQRARLVAEPSGAVALAALMTRPEWFAGRTIGVVISGGNLNFGDCKLGAGKDDPQRVP